MPCALRDDLGQLLKAGIRCGKDSGEFGLKRRQHLAIADEALASLVKFIPGVGDRIYQFALVRTEFSNFDLAGCAGRFTIATPMIMFPRLSRTAHTPEVHAALL